MVSSPILEAESHQSTAAARKALLFSSNNTRPEAGEFDGEQTAESRADLEIFLKKTQAQFWIQYDFLGSAKLKKASDFCELTYLRRPNDPPGGNSPASRERSQRWRRAVQEH